MVYFNRSKCQNTCQVASFTLHKHLKMVCWIELNWVLLTCKSSSSAVWNNLEFNYAFASAEGHRTLFIGVHVPLGGRKSHRRHRHRGHKHRKRDRERDSGLEDGRESPSFGKNLSSCLFVCFFIKFAMVIILYLLKSIIRNHTSCS